MRFIELFAGIGGFRYGLEKAGDYKCVWANEIDKYAIQIYHKNYGKKELYEGDIRGIPAEVIPDHDLLTAGFPCQAFSIAGRRKGFEDTRGTLFFEICRIAKIKRPNMLLLENVKGLINHQKGETFRIILGTLSELGYDCEWQVHNSKNFGVPQNRERVFIIGHFRGASSRKIFPLKENGGISEEKDKTDQRPTQAQYSTTLRGSEMKADHTFILHKNSTILTPKGRADDTFIVQNEHGRIRRLTHVESERLQGFPDGWTEAKGIPDGQRYKCLGNAVTTNVVTEIGKAIL